MKVTIGSATLYRGDCYDILPTLGIAYGLLTDPPYGWRYKGCAGPSVDPTPFLRASEAILWAGEPDREPKDWYTIRCGRWSAWSNVCGGGYPDCSDYRGENHPHEKPVELMDFCVSLLAGPLVVDPFMGSGSSGIAAVRRGRAYVGIERDERYFKIACRRIRGAQTD